MPQPRQQPVSAVAAPQGRRRFPTGGNDNRLGGKTLPLRINKQKAAAFESNGNNFLAAKRLCAQPLGLYPQYVQHRRRLLGTRIKPPFSVLHDRQTDAVKKIECIFH